MEENKEITEETIPETAPEVVEIPEEDIVETVGEIPEETLEEPTIIEIPDVVPDYIIPTESVEETEEETETTTEETTEEETETTTEETEEETAEQETVVIYEQHTEVPFMDKPLEEYTATEGLLLLIFILGLVALVNHMLGD